jgi:hypothetical protein
MKWLGFIALVLIESLAIFGLSLEQIGFTVPQAILISCYVVLLIITITGFIIAHFVNLQKERENEFRILVEKLRGQEEAIKTVKEQVFRIGQNVLISEEKLEDEEVVEMYDIPYLKNEVGMMIADYSSKHIYKTAKTLF